MDIKKLVTLSFDRNVGASDRVVRLVSGVGVAGVGWFVGAPVWVSVVATVFGLMWVATGVLSKCSIYYALGYSTCPARGDATRS